MKRITIITLILLMLALMSALAGCSGDDNEPESPTEAGSTNQISGEVENDADSNGIDTEELQRQADYDAAIAALEAGDYTTASRMFAELGDFEDSAEHRKEADYRAANAMLDAGDYAAAIEVFLALGDFRDSYALAATARLLPFVGIYRNARGSSHVITISEDGHLQHSVLDIDINNVLDDGSILVNEQCHGDYMAPNRMFIFPTGVPLSVFDHSINQWGETDYSRIRLFFTFSDAPDIMTNVFYRVEPFRVGELSFLPAPGHTHEFSFFGPTWETTRQYRIEEYDNGGIRISVIAATADGQPIDIGVFPEYIYFEDSSGLTRHRVSESGLGAAERVILFPIILGERFVGPGPYRYLEVVAVNETITTEAGTFENVVGISDCNFNTVFYAPGVGRIAQQGIRLFGEITNISRN